MMFSNAIVLLFLTLGLSSSIVHAIPSQSQKNCSDPSNPSTQNSTTVKGHSQLKSEQNGKNDTKSADPLSGKGNTTPVGNNKGNSTAVDNQTGKKNTTSTADSNKGNSTAATGKKNNGATSDPKSSDCLDPSVIAKGFQQNGQGNQADPGQVASLTSTNNFINFCVGQTLTNGQQVKTGSCNPAPMGNIPANTKMPSSKFTNPKNLDVLKSNTTFTVSMAIQNLITGNFVNAAQNYFAAPQQLNAQGIITGHSHVVIQQMESLTSTKVLDPATFAFFKGLNAAAQGGILSADVPGGLGPGTYRLASINTAANHQPALVPVAQHGSLDDVVYFQVTQDGKAAPSTSAANNPANNGTQSGNANNNNGGKAAGKDKSNASQPANNGTQSGDTGSKGKGTGKQDPTKGAPAKPSSTSGKRRSFRLEVRKDRY